MKLIPLEEKSHALNSPIKIRFQDQNDKIQYHLFLNYLLFLCIKTNSKDREFLSCLNQNNDLNHNLTLSKVEISLFHLLEMKRMECHIFQDQIGEKYFMEHLKSLETNSLLKNRNNQKNRISIQNNFLLMESNEFVMKFYNYHVVLCNEYLDAIRKERRKMKKMTKINKKEHLHPTQ